jgi:hypothetical protein
MSQHPRSWIAAEAALAIAFSIGLCALPCGMAYSQIRTGPQRPIDIPRPIDIQRPFDVQRPIDIQRPFDPQVVFGQIGGVTSTGQNDSDAERNRQLSWDALADELERTRSQDLSNLPIVEKIRRVATP